MIEAEWKLFRELRTVALDRFCQRVLSEVSLLASAAGKTNHERYLAVYKLIEKRDKELAYAFNDPRRSTALRQLACIQAHELLTAEELARFRQETRDSIRVFID